MATSVQSEPHVNHVYVSGGAANPSLLTAQPPNPGMGIFAMMASAGAIPGLASGTPFPAAGNF